MIHNLRQGIKGRDNFRLKLVRLPQRVWRALDIPVETFTGMISLLHGLNSELLPSRCRSVVTVHDLRALEFEDKTLYGPLLAHEEYKRRRDFFRRRLQLLPWSLKKAKRVISISNFTKKRIIENFGIPEESIDVVYHGVSTIFKKTEDEEIIKQIKEKFNIRKEYLLYVGKLDPMKNIERLIDAFRLIRRDFDVMLVLSGPCSLYRRVIEARIKDQNLSDDVVFTDYVISADLVALYNGATAFVLPSLYEGFGLPLIEAMRCGCPVIASNVGAIPEIVGDSAVLFDPLSEEKMAYAIASVLSDKRLRDRLINSGLCRAQSFTWEKTVTETIGVYRRCLS
jgi:glycosyltransferase involved in cell wall biosynthesis